MRARCSSSRGLSVAVRNDGGGQRVRTRKKRRLRQLRYNERGTIGSSPYLTPAGVWPGQHRRSAACSPLSCPFLSIFWPSPSPLLLLSCMSIGAPPLSYPQWSSPEYHQHKVRTPLATAAAPQCRSEAVGPSVEHTPRAIIRSLRDLMFCAR